MRDLNELLYLPWEAAAAEFKALYFARDESLLTARRKLAIIANTVCATTGITMDGLRGKCQTHRVAWARHTVAYLARKHLQLQFNFIGEYFGRGPKAVGTGYEKVAFCVKNRTAEKAQIDQIEQALASLSEL